MKLAGYPPPPPLRCARRARAAARRLRTRLLLALLGLAIPARADWPCWRGNSGSGAATDCGEDLVRNLADARLVWLSEERTYQTWPRMHRLELPRLYTGQAGPVLADGRLFFYYFMPDGKIVDEEGAGEVLQAEFDPQTLGFRTREEVANRYHSVTAEDVVLCLDPKTGKTLWKRAIPGAINLSIRDWFWTKEGSLLTPCAAYGKVFVVGNTFRVFALDAETGDTVWESKLDAAYERVDCVLGEAKGKRESKLIENWWTGAHAPVFADGVLCVDDEVGKIPRVSKGNLYGGGLVGFDAETGEKLWHLPVGANWWPGPVRWKCGTQEYFITGRGALIEPKTGKTLWGPFKGFLVAVSEEAMIMQVGGAGWECRQITAAGTKVAWTAPSSELNVEYDVSVIGGKSIIWTSAKAFHSLDLRTGTRDASAGSMYRERGRTRGALVYSDGIVLKEGNDILSVSRRGRLRGGEKIDGLPGYPGLFTAKMSTGCIDDGFWYVRLRDSLACLQLRKELHEKVTTAGEDVRKLVTLCRDEDPAVGVDAVVALRRQGAQSAEVVATLVDCLEKSHRGVSREASRALRDITPPPPGLVTAASSENTALRRNATYALSDLGALEETALLVAASDPLCVRGEEAAELLKERTRNNVAAVAERITTARSDFVCKRLQGVVDANLSEATMPAVLDVLKANLTGADPSAARGLVQSAVRIGTADTWAFFESIVTDKGHRYRTLVLEALPRWPGNEPAETLRAIHDDPAEDTAVRKLAFQAVLPIETRLLNRMPKATKFARIEELFGIADGLGETVSMFGKARLLPPEKALCILAGYLRDRQLRQPALEAMKGIVKEGLRPLDISLSPATLTMLVELTDPDTRQLLVETMRLNVTPLKPDTLKALASMLDTAKSRPAATMLTRLAELGSDAAWTLAEDILNNADHPHRRAAVEALPKWPTRKPAAALDKLAGDKTEEKALRAAAFKAGLSFAGRKAMTLPSSERAALLEAREAQAEELGVTPFLLMALGKTGAVSALDKLKDCFSDPALAADAMAAIEACARNLERIDIPKCAAKLEALARTANAPDRKKRLAKLAKELRVKDKQLPPAIGAGLGDELDEAIGIPLDL